MGGPRSGRRAGALSFANAAAGVSWAYSLECASDIPLKAIEKYGVPISIERMTSLLLREGAGCTVGGRRFAVPLAALVTITALPRLSILALPTHHAIIRCPGCVIVPLASFHPSVLIAPIKAENPESCWRVC